MGRTAVAALEEHYRGLQRRWVLVDRTTDYARLVVPNGNSSEPLHRWFHFKEAFSSQLLIRLFKDAAYAPAGEISVCDPFAGVGTTVLSAIHTANEGGVSVRALGVERNPAVWEIAAAKVQGALGGEILAAPLLEEAQRVAERVRQTSRGKALKSPSPTLSNTDYFDARYVDELLRLRLVVDEVSDEALRQILRACVAASVEPAGRLRRDGRALRFDPSRRPQRPLSTFMERAQSVADDLRSVTRVPPGSVASVELGDGRHADAHAHGQKFDWVVFSPPYPNNIDYTEVYKTEAWALGCYTSTAQMKEQRLRSVRSHPSIKFPDEYYFHQGRHAGAVEELIDPILNVVPDNRYYGGRVQLIRGYVDDMLLALHAAWRMAHHNSRCIFIVGNSMHGTDDDRFVIAADLLMAALAELVGWRVEEIRVARSLRRRGGSPLLRESVVSLVMA